jgi:hypothetical protein
LHWPLRKFAWSQIRASFCSSARRAAKFAVTPFSLKNKFAGLTLNCPTSRLALRGTGPKDDNNG